MLTLKRIKRSDGYIEAYYTPEDSKEEGYVKIKLSDDEVVTKQLTSYDGITEMYFTMARNKLWRIKDDTDIPTEAKVMWY
jgi:hypothetical protein